ncbi:ABC transporter substrate-binding protein [Bacillus alkalicellulosilyticus]|uniref:ABC transporter substrate-binding protein n=1 Tax=Alkalihalobacterium alkalicellulosilyticum TaxID=1912214 RepID=UPI00099778C6|nr:extracellular solute-binding protein [Bacillus alkalicellulosilyticus]
MSKIKLLLAALFAVMVIAACGGGDADPAPAEPAEPSGEPAEAPEASGDPVELTMWLFGTTGYDELAKQYTAENPHITFNIQEGDMQDMSNNLFTALSAGSGAPDIAMVEVGQIDRFKDAADRFHNLYDLGAADVQGNFVDWAWSVGGTADGSIQIGLPTDIGPTAMFYRSDLFEAAGLPTDPAEVAAQINTWEAYAEAGAKLAENGVLLADGPELIFNALRDQAPVSYFNEQDELIINDEPYIREAYDYTAELIADGTIGNIELWTPEWGAGMGDGTYATLLAPAWMQGVIKGNAPDASGSWNVAVMPEGAGNWGGSYLAIPAESDHAPEAYAFISWVTSVEGQTLSFLDKGLFPSAPAVYDDAEFLAYTDEYFGGAPTAQIFGEAAEQVQYVYKGRHYQIAQEEIQEALSRVTQGEDPDAEWDAAVDRIENRLARQ